MRILFSLLFILITSIAPLNAQTPFSKTIPDSIVNGETAMIAENTGEVSFPTELDPWSYPSSNDDRINTINDFLARNRDYLPKGATIEQLRETLMGLDEAKLRRVLYESEYSFQDPNTVLLVSILVPLATFNLVSGIDRIMIGETGLGILKTITWGGCGVWTVVDWFIIQKKTRQYNLETIMELNYLY